MNWQLVIAGFVGALVTRLYDRVSRKIAQRSLNKSERIRQNLIVKLDTDSLPELAKAVTAEIERRRKRLA